MSREATGQAIERKLASGDTSFYARLRAGNRRQARFLGRASEGWTMERARQEVARRVARQQYRQASWRRVGWVYFLARLAHLGEIDRVKIGWTSGDLARRARQINSTAGGGLQFMGAFRTFKRSETRLHQRFQIHRLEGEWFEPTPELLHLVEVLGRQGREAW